MATYNNSRYTELNQCILNGGQTFFANTGASKEEKVLDWLSMIPYHQHHAQINESRLNGSVEWLFEKAKYKEWRASKVSKLLLLRGIPGAGKTYIMSKVIDTLLKQNNVDADDSVTESVGYFYCNRGEQSRCDPKIILATLIHQLACTKDGSILQPVLDVYKNRKDRHSRAQSCLSVNECQDLLVNITNIYSVTTICVDALDEVDRELRKYLLESLKNVMERSKKQVKIFATSRMDGDIYLQLQKFPMMQLEAEDNCGDIERYIKERINASIEDGLVYLLQGTTAENELCTALYRKCKGMFQLAKLQISVLCKMRVLTDTTQAIGTLPETLDEAYERMYNDIQSRSRSSGQLAINAFRWIQSSYEPIPTETLLDAVTWGLYTANKLAVRHDKKGRGGRMPVAALLDLCENLLVHDEGLDVFRFAHLSVDEYLETKLNAIESHASISKVCLSLLCGSWDGYDQSIQAKEGVYKDRHLLLYSALLWPDHLRECEHVLDQDDCLKALSLQMTSNTKSYEKWHYYCTTVVQRPKQDIWDIFPRNKGSFWEKRYALRQHVYKSPLFTASLFGLSGTFERLFLNTSIDPALQDILCTQACDFGYTEIARLLIDQNTSATVMNQYLNIAIYKRHENTIRMLIEKGADISGDSKPLHGAFNSNSEAIVLQLIESGANIFTVNRDGESPLYRAVVQGYVGAVQLLIEKGVDILEECHGKTPLQTAIQSKQDAIALILISNGADISSNMDGLSPLHLAVENGLEGVVRFLIDGGVEVLEECNGRTSLYTALQNGQEAIALLLIDSGADVYSTEPLLYAAACHGCEVVVRLLIDCGINVSHCGQGKTPLEGALEYEQESIARLLIESGADISATGESVLYYAVSKGYEDVVRLLIINGVAVSTWSYSRTFLGAAIDLGHERILQLLLNSGADIMQKAGYYGTPLHEAVQKGRENIVQLLINWGADISANYQGKTPLYVGAESGRKSIMQLLINSGADFSASIAEELLYVAAKGGHESVVQLLIDQGAKIFKSCLFESILWDLGKSNVVLSCCMNMDSRMENQAKFIRCLCKALAASLQKLTTATNPKITTIVFESIAATTKSSRSLNLVPIAESIQAPNSGSYAVNDLWCTLVACHDMWSGCYNILEPTFLELLILGEHTFVVQELIDMGVDIFAPRFATREISLLNFAIKAQCFKMAMKLIKLGADVNVADKYGQTPLHLVAQNSVGVNKLHFQDEPTDGLVQLLVDHGADISAADQRGRTPLHMLVSEDYFSETKIIRRSHGFAQLKTLRLFIEEGANPSATDECWYTPLHLAVEPIIKNRDVVVPVDDSFWEEEPDAVMRQITLVDELINAGANVSDVDSNGQTPLHRAVRYENNMKMVEALIVRGTNVSCVDFNGRTPLHLAVSYENTSVVETLIDLGADLLATDHRGLSPLEYAMCGGPDVIIKLLIKRGAPTPLYPPLMPVSST